jgi:predicted phosphodiesterase
MEVSEQLFQGTGRVMSQENGQIRDLGRLDGPVWAYGGPYSNLQATRAFLDLADAAGVPVSHRICTGDVIAYGADPLDTWAEVAARGGTVVAGNCERQLGRGAAECGCGFETGSSCDLLSRGWYPHALAAVGRAGPDLHAALAACPDIAVFSHALGRVAVIHGGATDIARFLWPDSPERAFAEEIAAIEARVGPVDVILAGHAGIAFQIETNGRLWINAGAVGLPPHDGRPETRYAILDRRGVQFHRLGYDHAAAADAMAAAGLTQGYHATLRTGIWPSEDILPPSLRR